MFLGIYLSYRRDLSRIDIIRGSVRARRIRKCSAIHTSLEGVDKRYGVILSAAIAAAYSRLARPRPRLQFHGAPCLQGSAARRIHLRLGHGICIPVRVLCVRPRRRVEVQCASVPLVPTRDGIPTRRTVRTVPGRDTPSLPTT